jgi:16S rRNA (uracil1498-N3)-methyltransferase
MVELAELVKNLSRFDKVITLHESAAKPLTSSTGWQGCKNLLVIVGPEGGLTDEELRALSAAGTEVLRLGDPVIRADLAGALAMGAIHALTGNWERTRYREWRKH